MSAKSWRKNSFLKSSLPTISRSCQSHCIHYISANWRTGGGEVRHLCSPPAKLNRGKCEWNAKSIRAKHTTSFQRMPSWHGPGAMRELVSKMTGHRHTRSSKPDTERAWGEWVVCFSVRYIHWPAGRHLTQRSVRALGVIERDYQLQLCDMLFLLRTILWAPTKCKTHSWMTTDAIQMNHNWTTSLRNLESSWGEKIHTQVTGTQGRYSKYYKRSPKSLVSQRGKSHPDCHIPAPSHLSRLFFYQASHIPQPLAPPNYCFPDTPLTFVSLFLLALCFA